jgi:hypothetical protein
MVFGQSSKKTFKVACIAFYNLENLYDTIDDPAVDDAEFLPAGPNMWNSERYNIKIAHMSEAISQVGDEFVKGGPTILGVSEIENEKVLIDLINSPSLKPGGYEFVHYNSPDRRGVDVAMIYKRKDFQVLSSHSHRLTVSWRNDFKSRDQLVVCGMLDNERIYVVVNHWPSRGNGPEYRAAAATLTRSICDSIQNFEPQAKIFVMGDLNDDPIDPSVFKILDAVGDQKKMTEKQMFNPMYKMFKDGIGSLAYRDSWNLFDQIIISKPLTGDDKSSFKCYQTKVFNRQFMVNQDGPYKGYPWRSFAAGSFQGGYSDHFPVYMFVIKEK